MSNPYDFVQAPNIAGAGNYASMLANILNPNQRNGQQQQQPQQPNNLATLLQKMLGGGGASPNPLAPGGQFSPLDSYINANGDLMSGGQITPG